MDGQDATTAALFHSTASNLEKTFPTDKTKKFLSFVFFKLNKSRYKRKGTHAEATYIYIYNKFRK